MSARFIKKPALALFTAGLLTIAAPVALAAPQELTLGDSIAAAVRNNPALKMAGADRDKAAWSVDEAEASRWPSLSLGSTYSRQPGMDGQIGDGVTNSVRLNWQLYSGGRVDGQVSQAEQSLQSAEAGVAKAEQQVRLDAAAAYFTVLQNNNLLAVNEQTVKNLREHMKTAQEKYAVGLVAKSDMLRAEVEVANAEQNLIKARNAYELSLAGLKNVIGLDQAAEVALTDTLTYEKYDKTLDESLAQARQTRPELAQAQAAVNMAGSGVKIAESGKLPTLSFGVSKGWNETLLPQDNGNWSMNLTASWNIFDAGVTGSRIKQAGAGLEKARQQASHTEDAVELEVRQFYLTMQEAEKRLSTTDVAVAKAEEDLAIARTKYDAGVGTNIDVIDAQLALTQAKTNYYQALYDFNVNKAKLTKAVGLAVQ